MKVCPNGRRLFRLPMKCQHGELCKLKKALEGEGWGEGDMPDEEAEGSEGPGGDGPTPQPGA